MPPLLDAQTMFGPAPVALFQSAPMRLAADRFPADFFDLSKPLGNDGRDPSMPATWRTTLRACLSAIRG